MARGAARRIGYWEAVSIGVGGMVGGGIFAVLGLAVQLARGGTPIAFAVAGGVALLTAYSYAKLSVALRSQGGTVSFLNRAFGPGLATGALNVLLWLSYVVMLALYAHAFGSYAATFLPSDSALPWKPVLMSAILLVITGLNLLGSAAIGEAEDWIVALKIAILALFVAVGLPAVDTARLSPAAWAPPLHLITGGMLIFVAYEGFELIANTAQDVRSPGKTLPRAFFTAVSFVLVLYILVAYVTVGSLSVPDIVSARDYALAEAARPGLGQAGFVWIAIAAMLSTASAINATLYGATRLSYSIARDGELPAALERKLWSEPEGLLVTALLSLGLVNLLDLSSISTAGSAGFLLLFAAVNAANVRLACETSSRGWISALGVAACLAALAALLWRSAVAAPAQLVVPGLLVLLSLAIEGGYRLATGREIHVYPAARSDRGA